MKQRLDSKLIPYDITNQQARLLGYLDKQLKQGHEIVQKDLERTIKLRGSSITSLLQGLERKGFIIRNTGSKDGRTKQIRITEKGNALIDEVETTFQDVETLLLKGMSDEEKEIYQKLLKVSYDNFKAT
ncbi:MarR family winged helix-turn-helix transcriptional regulator [Desulfosporosinus sp. SB140]|uniref:MarR family winged helix-turn-helix transcriptional regulator n=1 Tax=Desulfosporosinus paludis TaxID=3115649 RepID=UPI00388D734A